MKSLFIILLFGFVFWVDNDTDFKYIYHLDSVDHGLAEYAGQNMPVGGGELEAGEKHPVGPEQEPGRYEMDWRRYGVYPSYPKRLIKFKVEKGVKKVVLRPNKIPQMFE